MWTDASDIAVAAFAVELKVPTTKVFSTVDNLLPQATTELFSSKGCTLQADLLPWHYKKFIEVRDDRLFDPHSVNNTHIIHRNLCPYEKLLSSTERELIAALHLIQSMAKIWTGKVITLHMDSQNAVDILSNGSSKPRLNKYAELFFKLRLANNIKFNFVWIPRTMNNLTDYLSKHYDFDDFSVTDEFYARVIADFLVSPSFDRFATYENRKVDLFNSPTLCPFTDGVDAFNYDWSMTRLNWIFCPIRLIARTLEYLRISRASALILIPQWRHSYFFPMFMHLSPSCVRQKRVYKADNIFHSGSDKSSFFGPGYRGNVEIWYIDYK